MKKKIWIIIGLILLLAAIAYVAYRIIVPPAAEVTIKVRITDESGNKLSDIEVGLDTGKVRSDENGDASFDRRVRELDTLEVKAARAESTKTVLIVISKENIEDHSALATIRFVTTPPKPFTVFISSSPSGALVTLDDSATGRTTTAAFALTRGQHTISLSKKGYGPRDTTISIAQDSTSLAFVLTKTGKTPVPPATTGTVTIASTPSGATIAINGTKEEGKTPLRKTLPFGSYSVDVTYQDSTYRTSLTLSEDQPRQKISALFPSAPPPPPPPVRGASITVRSLPSGAPISVDGKPTGSVTPSDVPVSTGNHEVAVTSDGKEKKRNVTVQKGSPLIVTFVFKCDEALESARADFKSASFDKVIADLTGCEDPGSLPLDLQREAIFMLAVSKYNMKKFEDARQDLLRLTGNLDKTNAVAYYYLGLAFEQLGKYRDAIKSFQGVEEHESFLPPDKKDEILCAVKFSYGSDYNLLSYQTQDPDMKGEFQDTALRYLEEFVSGKCCSADKNKQQCKRAQELINDLK